MDKRQTLTEYMVKEITYHIENRECITSFCLNVNTSHSNIKAFLAGAVSLRLKKADAMLKYIEKFQSKLKECETCEGKGEGVFSCCTGENVDNELMLCPHCYEHLAEDKCDDCDGRGFVLDTNA